MGGLFSSPSPTSNESSSPDQSRILQFSSVSSWREHFESAKDSLHLMVIDFTATWCGPCRSMEPVMIDLANRFSEVAFVKIDVDELKEVAAEWGVEAMPTFVMVKKGKEVDRIVGARKDELLKKIEKHMVG